MTKTKKKTDAEKKSDSEWRAIRTLQEKHGFWLARMPAKSQRTTSTFSRNRATGKMTFSTRYVLQLVVPMDSELAKAMLESDKKLDAKKARKVRSKKKKS